MGVIRWADQRSQALTIWDIGVLKFYCAVFGMIIGAFVPVFVRQHLVWFIGTVVVLGLVLGYRWFTAQPRQPAGADG